MIGIGIIGAGHFGAIHAEAIAEVEDLRLVAATSRRNAPELRGFCDRHGCRPIVAWQELLEAPDVDAVAIATPHDLHEEIAIAALLRGKHVLLEKPMAPTATACERIAHAAAETSVRILVGHTMQFTLPMMTAKTLIGRGEIGKPLLGRGVMIKKWMAANRQPWHLDDATGGGMLFTAGIHALDCLVSAMGQSVDGVTAFMGTAFHAQQADDYAHLALRFDSGAFGHVDSIGYKDGAGSRWTEIVGETGVIHIDPITGVTIGRDDKWTLVEGSCEPDFMHRAVVREWRSLRDAIVDGAALPVSLDYAADLIRIIEAARVSSRTHAEVRF